MLDQLQELVQEAITATRTLTVELSPPVLQGEGLVEALQWLANQMEATHHLQVHLQVHLRVSATSQEPVIIERPELRGLLFQIVRELLFNIVKYAGVGEAWVTLHQGPDALRITVEDRGKGFQVETGQSMRSGFGLSSIRHRLDLFGGQIEIHSAPGAGTRVRITIPQAVLAGKG
jgi:signal transduction histidine kinase